MESLGISSDVVALVAWVAVPWALGKTISYIRSRIGGNNKAAITALATAKKRLLDEKKRRAGSKTWFERAVSGMLLAAAIHAVVHLSTTEPTRNILAEWDVPLTAPSFLLRNKFRAHMAANYEGWTEGAELGRGRWSVEEEHDIQLLETLYDRLKSPASRQLYLTAGHNAFMHCSWCKEDVDFLMYAAPDVMAAYVYFFIVVGLGSMSSRKIGWRNYAATILAVTMSVDLCITFAADETLKKELHGSPSNMDHLLSPYVKGFYLRYAMFALVALLMWLFDDRSATTQLTDQDIVTDLAVQLRSVYNRQQAGRIAKAAALGNKDLRRTYFEWYKLKEADKDAVYRDEDFKEMRRQALRSYNLTQIMFEVKALGESFIEMARLDGLLHSIVPELPAEPFDANSILNDLDNNNSDHDNYSDVCVDNNDEGINT